MPTKLLSSTIVIKAPSVRKELKTNIKSFLASRFYSLNKNHNQVILIGSSLSKQDKDIEKDKVLDASGTLTTQDHDGITNGARMALCDGLGGGNGDPREDDSIAKVARFCCEAFLEDSNEFNSTLYSISKRSLSQSLKCSKNQRYDSFSSISATVYSYNKDKNQYQCELGNVGDGIIMVIGKDFKVKYVVGAKHRYRGFGFWTPSSLQMLSENHSKTNEILVRESICVSEGDLIISMTDGVWSNLKTTLISKSESEKIIGINRNYIENILKPLKEKKHVAVFEIAKLITQKSMAQHLKKRKHISKLIKILEDLHCKNNSIVSISEAEKYFLKHKKVKENKLLRAILFNDRFSDGVKYKKNVEIPLDLIIHDLKNQTIGDCSTINVSRVPYQLDELIRCFIEQPSKRVALAKRMQSAIKSKNTLYKSLKRLSLETKQAGPKRKLQNISFVPLFKKEELVHAKLILENLFNLTKICKKKRNYQDRLKNIAEYLKINTQIDGKEIELLLKMMTKDVAPKTNSWLPFYTSTQEKKFNEFKLNISKLSRSAYSDVSGSLIPSDVDHYSEVSGSVIPNDVDHLLSKL